jgi:hypothetical protein
MSSLLEQAIVDAKALKDAALKNAEQMVIEKYSNQIKDAVSILLEQEEEDLDLGMGLPSPDEEEEDTVSRRSDDEALEDIPSSETGQVELDLDAIEKRIQEIEEEEGIAATDALQSDKVDHDDIAADMSDDIQASADADSLATETLTQLEEEMEEVFVDEIMESLKVDIKPQKRGWMGVSNEELDLATEQELARVQDDEVKEQLEALKSALNKLEESNTRLNRNNKNLIQENETLTVEINAHKSVVSQLKEKFDAVNTSNAKLLYINRTLDCGSLNERQKKSIVEAIAKAEDAREAKVIYETLQNTVETRKEKSPESLSEAVNGRSSLLVRSREENRTVSADLFADRMQRLAGIKQQ